MLHLLNLCEEKKKKTYPPKQKLTCRKISEPAKVQLSKKKNY